MAGEESGDIWEFLKVKSNVSADAVDMGYKEERTQNEFKIFSLNS